MLSPEIMYKALLDKDSSFEGAFIVAVKTTGIFCRTTCTARKPKFENVEFFDDTKSAIKHGYRPCKICKPLEKLNETPEYISNLINEINETGVAKFKDYDLVQRGIEPNALRRWFKKHHGITFQAYLRMLRINTAFKKIKSGDSVSAAAFDTGYESISGFADAFKSIVGVAPSYGKGKNIIVIKRIETELGTMFAGAVDEGICLLEFSDRKALETEFKELSKLLDATIIQGEHEHIDLIEKELNEYYEGKLNEFTVPIKAPGTQFQMKVWEELRTIPYATTRSYGEQSIRIGSPAAVRAVANANGKNRISIVIPCHRVIGADGHLTGYGGGVWRKQRLLDLEKGFSNSKINIK